MKLELSPTRKCLQERGFTLADLLVLLLMMAFLSSLFLPALAATKTGATSIQCLENHQQLLRAWQMYSADNMDALVAAKNTTGSALYNGRLAWVTNDLGIGIYTTDWYSQGPLINSPLWSYLGKNIATFRCPADTAFRTLAGAKLLRIRNYSMNEAFAAGEWLSNTNWRTYAKSAEIVKPKNTFVFIDENSYNIDDGGFAVICDGLPGSGTSGRWPALVSIPAFNHAGAAGISFADGHAELHQWHGPFIPSVTGTYNFGLTVPDYASGDREDLVYLARNTTVRK